MKKLLKDEVLTDEELDSHKKNKDYQRAEEIKDAIHLTKRWAILSLTPIAVFSLLFLICYLTVNNKLDVLSGLALNVLTFMAGVVTTQFTQRD